MFAARKMMMGGKRGPKLEEAYASDVAGTSSSITVPISSSTQIGDLMVLICGLTSGTPASSTATGWNRVLDNPVNPRTAIFWKIAQAGDAGSTVSVTYGGPVSGGRSYAVLRFSNAAFDAIGSYGTSSTTTPVVAPSLNVSGGILLLVARSTAAGTMTTPAGMDVAASVSTGSSSFVFTEKRPSGATGTRETTPSGLGANFAILLSVTGP